MPFDIGGHTLQQFTSQVQMRHFAAPEPERHFDLVAIVEKLEHVAHLDVIVIGVGVGAEFDFLDLDGFLLLTRLSFFLLLLVFEFAEIHDLTNGRIGIWRNLDKIKSDLICHFHGARWCDYTYVLAFCAYQSNFIRADTVVDARSGLTHRGRVMWSAGYGLKSFFGVRVLLWSKVEAPRPVFKRDLGRSALKGKIGGN